MTAAATSRRTTELDELTLRRAQRGDARAWRELIGRYEQPIHALVWRMLAGRGGDRVPDLVQETFVRVLRALPSFELAGPATLSTWILTIATRLTLNELRRPQRTVELGDHAGSEPADAGIERRQLGAAIAAAMAQLPDAQRTVLVLREYHELDYADIAAILELDLGTVKSRLSRARATLREHLVVAMPELGRRHG